MDFQDQSIKRKTLALIMLASVVVLLLAATTLTVLDLRPLNARLRGYSGLAWVREATLQVAFPANSA